MSRYNYRIKQRVFRQSDINRHQNFQDLEKRHAAHKRSANIMRLVLILVALVVLIGILVFAANADQKKPSYQNQEMYPEMGFDGIDQEIN
ncbi:MAG: hypothetical protein ABJ004_11670 [Cyclobacteriaceae bacterium]